MNRFFQGVRSSAGFSNNGAIRGLGGRFTSSRAANDASYTSGS